MDSTMHGYDDNVQAYYQILLLHLQLFLHLSVCVEPCFLCTKKQELNTTERNVT